jgi:hypothetical protein
MLIAPSVNRPCSGEGWPRGHLTAQDVGGTSSTVIGSVAVHGSRGGDQVMLRNGVETLGLNVVMTCGAGGVRALESQGPSHNKPQL